MLNVWERLRMPFCQDPLHTPAVVGVFLCCTVVIVLLCSDSAQAAVKQHIAALSL